MTLEQAKTIKECQELYYHGIEELPEKVTVSKVIIDTQGKLEIHLVDNCYIPERDLGHVFLTFDECAKFCEKQFQLKLQKLREMMSLNEGL